MKRKLIIFIVFCALFLSSCSNSKCVFSENVMRDYDRIVDISNGVTRKEAELIAQHELVIRHTQYYFLNIFEKPVLNDNGAWEVKLHPYADGPKAGTAIKVCVDKINGRITCWEEVPLETELREVVF